MSQCAICHGVKLAPKTWGQWFCCLPPVEYRLIKCARCSFRYHHGCLLYYLLGINEKHTINDTFDSVEHVREMKCPNSACILTYSTDVVARTFQDHKSIEYGEIVQTWCKWSIWSLLLIMVSVCLVLDHLSTHLTIQKVDEWCQQSHDPDNCNRENDINDFNYFILWFAGYILGVGTNFVIYWMIGCTLRHFCNYTNESLNLHMICHSSLIMVTLLIKFCFSIVYYNDIFRGLPDVSLHTKENPANLEFWWYINVIFPCNLASAIILIYFVCLWLFILGRCLICMNHKQVTLSLCRNIKYIFTQWCCDIRNQIGKKTRFDNEARLGVLVV